MFNFNNHAKNWPLFLNPSTGVGETEATAKQQSTLYLKNLYQDAGETVPANIQ